MIATVLTHNSAFDLAEPSGGHPERTFLSALRASAGACEFFVLSAREFAHLLHAVPNVKRGKVALRGPIGTQTLVLLGHG